MRTELNAIDRARLRAQVIDAGLAVAIAAHLRGGPRAELRQAVVNFVADAKRTMTPPQDVIASLKAHVQREAQPHMGAEEYPRLVEVVVGWGIEEYYRES
jgi:transposase